MINNIIKLGTWETKGLCFLLTITFKRMEVVGRKGGRYEKAPCESKQTFYAESKERAIKLAKDYLKEMELV